MTDDLKIPKNIVPEIDAHASKEGEIHSLQDLGKEMANGQFLQQIYSAAEIARPHYTGNFYIEVFFKKEDKLFTHMLRSKPISRTTCPTPQYDHAVFFVKGHDIHFCWILPDKRTCESLILSKNELNDDQKSLLPAILAMIDGSLHNMVREINKEGGQHEGIIFIKDEGAVNA